jgi:HEAT repeat protein
MSQGVTFDSIIATFRERKGPSHFRTVAALVSLGKSAVVPLVALLLNDEDGDVRQVAAEALGEIGDTRAVEALSSKLTDPVPGVREMAAWALSKLADPRAIHPLILALGSHEEVEVRDNVEWALEQIGEAAVEALIDALHDEDEMRSSRAAYVLGQIGDSRAFVPLVEMLDSKDASLRGHAVGALAEMGDPRGIEPLTRLVNDPVEWVRKIAMSALQDLRNSIHRNS